MPTYTIHDCRNCGIDHEWQFTAPTLQELWMIKEVTVETDKEGNLLRRGMTGADFFAGLETLDPAAWAALLYVLHKRDGIKIPFRKIDLDMENMEVSGLGEDEDEGKDAETRPNPTRQSGRPRKAASSPR